MPGHAVSLLRIVLLILAVSGARVLSQSQVTALSGQVKEKAGSSTVAAVTPASPDLALARVSDAVWIHVSYQVLNGARTPANGLVVRAPGGGVVLVDTPWDDEKTRQLLGLIEKQVGGRVKLALITHAHDDRIGGIRALMASGIRVVSGQLTRELAVKQGLPAPEAATQNPRAFDVDGTKVELFYPGAGHTRDNTVVWVPDAKVLFGGCLVKDVRATSKGNIADADLAAWPGTIENVMGQYPDAARVIPGHGDPGGRELLEHTIRVVTGI